MVKLDEDLQKLADFFASDGSPNGSLEMEKMFGALLIELMQNTRNMSQALISLDKKLSPEGIQELARTPINHYGEGIFEAIQMGIIRGNRGIETR